MSLIVCATVWETRAGQQRCGLDTGQWSLSVLSGVTSKASSECSGGVVYSARVVIKMTLLHTDASVGSEASVHQSCDCVRRLHSL